MPPDLPGPTETTGVQFQPLSTKLLHYWSHTNRPILLISQFQANLHQLHSNKTSYLSNFPLFPIFIPLPPPPPPPVTTLSRLLCHSTILCHVYHASTMLCHLRLPSARPGGQATAEYQCSRVPKILRVPASSCEFQCSLRVPASSCEFQCSNERR